MRPKQLIHPGEILREGFLNPLGLSPEDLVKALHLPANEVNALLSGKRSITAEIAAALATRFGTTPEFWISAQQRWDREKDKNGRD